jgi:hypothetical protein
MKVKNGFQVWVDRAIQPPQAQASGSWWIDLDRTELNQKAHEELQQNETLEVWGGDAGAVSRTPKKHEEFYSRLLGSRLCGIPQHA